MRSSPHPSLYSLQPGSCLGSHCGFLGKLVSPGTAHLGVLGGRSAPYHSRVAHPSYLLLSGLARREFPGEFVPLRT